MALVTVQPSQLKKLLAETIAARLPTMIVGAPGIGKSDIVHQAAEQAGADVIISHPAVEDPTDSKGLPWPGKDGTRATFLPFGELAMALEAKKPTVWFLDDLGQATPAVQAAKMQLILARRVNSHVLPDCVTFIAATNRRVDRAGVSGILEPVKSRFSPIVELVPSVQDFSAWAFKSGIDPRVVAFVRFRDKLLHDFDPKSKTDMENFPCPRTWAAVSNLLQKTKIERSTALLYPAVAGTVGEAAAAEFCGFLKVYKDLPNLDAILVSPDTAKLPTEPSALYAVAAGLAERANESNFARVMTYLTRLHDAGKTEIAVYAIRYAIEKTPDIQNAPAFIAAVSGDFGNLISGGKAI